MKTTKSKNTIELVKEAKRLIDEVRFLEKKRDALKKKIYEIIGEEKNLKAGIYLVVVTDCEKMMLDAEKIKEELGQDSIERLSRLVPYKTMSIKLA